MSKLPAFRKTTLFARLVPALLALALGAAPASADSAYFIGNSVTDTVKYEGLQALAVARGKTQPWGRQMIPGAPLEWLWDHPVDGFTQAPYGYPTNALPNYAWDVLSLQPFDRSLVSDLDYIQRYIGLLYGADAPTSQQLANRDATRILIYGRWPRQDDPARAGGPRDYDTLWLRTYSDADYNSRESADYANDLTLAVRGVSVSGVSLAGRTFMVPAGHVMYELNQQMKAGQVPGYTNIFQIYTDGIHLNNVGSYLTACTFFAVIYRESPVGLPVPSQYGTIDADLVTRIQETVWSVVQTQTLSGVPSAGNLLLATLAVPPAYQATPYSTTLMAVGGIAPRAFAVTGGTLPGGVTLSSAGVLSGTPTEAGDFTFTVTVSDATTPAPITASRTFNLRVDVDTSPVITTPAALPAIQRGDRYDLALGATGGNGALSWSLVSGSLPPGIQLGSGGLLFGSALAEGSYSFTLRVADIDSPPDTDSRAFTLQVGPPSAETLLAVKTLSPVRVDGDLAETHWNLAHMAARTLLGNPDNTTQFGLLWDADNLHIAVRVMDTRLSDGTGAGAERDAIELFLDAYNDKQAEFNVQHRQFRVALDGQLFERGGRVSGVKHGLLLVPGGYQLEISVPWTNLGITPIAGQTVIGLDIANDDSDAIAARQHYHAFAFSDPHDPRPSQFGSVILSPDTVSGTGGEPAAPAGPAPVAHEPFDYAAGVLHGVGSAPSFGFTGAWEVGDGAAATTYAVEGNASLAYGQLGASGRYMTGGYSWKTAGRLFDVAGAFAPWKRAADAFVGKPGTTLWISYLARPLKSIAAMKFSLDDTVSLIHDNNGRLRVQQAGGVWRLALMGDSVLAPTTVAVAAETTYFMVIRIDFGATSTASLYVNPVLGTEPPSTASTTASTTSADFKFYEMQLYPNSDAAAGQFDEVRFGATWESVVPMPPAPVASVVFSPLPGAFAGDLSVTLSTATAGAVIHYTTDGSAPTLSSPVYAGPVALSATTTIRAIAVKDGAASAVAGGVYARLSPYAAWTEGIAWPAPAAATGAETADPDGDNLQNILEFALGTDPLVADASPVRFETSPLQLSLSYPRAHAEIVYTVETSTDLLEWGTDGVIQDTVTPPGGTATALVPYDPFITPVRFLRLRVEP